MTDYYIIKKNGKSYILPITMGFCISKDGIEVLGCSDTLWELKPKDIEGRGIGTDDILRELRQEYRRLTRVKVKD